VTTHQNMENQIPADTEFLKAETARGAASTGRWANDSVSFSSTSLQLNKPAASRRAQRSVPVWSPFVLLSVYA